MAIKKVYELAVDLKRTSVRVNIPVLVQGDSAEFRIRLLDNGAELSTEQLTGITKVSMKSGYDAQTVIQTVGELQGNVAVFRLQKGELFRSGTVQAMVQLEDTEDRISTLRFQYQVIPDLSGNYIPGEQDITVFQRYMNEAQAKIDEMAATDVAQLTAQLAEEAQEIELLKTDKASKSEVQDLVVNKAEKDYVDANLELKRSKSEKITSDDLDTSSNASKIKPINVSDELMTMFSPAGTVNPVIPDGGVVKEKIANSAVDHTKLDFGGVKNLFSNLSASEEHPHRGKAITFQQISSAQEITFYKQIHVWGNDIVQYSLVPNSTEASKGGTKITFASGSWDGEKLKVSLSTQNVLVIDLLTMQAVIRVDMSQVKKTDIILMRTHYGAIRGGALTNLLYDLPHIRGFEDKAHFTNRSDKFFTVEGSGTALTIRMKNFYIKRGTVELGLIKTTTPVKIREGTGTYDVDTGEYVFTLLDNELLLYNTALHLIYKLNHTSNTGEQYGSHVWLLARNNQATLTGGLLRELYNGVTLDALNSEFGVLKTKVDNINPSSSSSPSITDRKMIGHRGLSRFVPENTILAYTEAGKYGIWGGETDIRLTSDGHFVVIHDATVDRTTNGTGNVSSMTLAQIKALTVDGGFNADLYPGLTVPTLSEYLQACKSAKIVPVIHVYTPISADAQLLEEIGRWGMLSNCVIITFDKAQIVSLRNLSSQVQLQLLVASTFTNADVDWCAENKCDIDPNIDNVTKAVVDYAHSKGLLVNCYNTNTYDYAQKAFEMGVDFVTTDILINESKLIANNTIKRVTETDLTNGAHASLTRTTKTSDFADGEWNMFSNGVVRVKENTTQRGRFTVDVSGAYAGDVVEVEAYFRSVSGNPPRMRLEYSEGTTSTLIGEVIHLAGNDWNKISLKMICTQGAGLPSEKYVVSLGYLNSLDSEFEFRDAKIKHYHF